mmetsp:Transcript_2947/g.10435  ORF Transcript_2947/g.10435 Transcript_2947/m.10435 type:complete len:215 (+) Transcript_2947:1199-1843(+)
MRPSGPSAAHPSSDNTTGRSSSDARRRSSSMRSCSSSNIASTVPSSDTSSECRLVMSAFTVFPTSCSIVRRFHCAVVSTSRSGLPSAPPTPSSSGKSSLSVCRSWNHPESALPLCDHVEVRKSTHTVAHLMFSFAMCATCASSVVLPVPAAPSTSTTGVAGPAPPSSAASVSRSAASLSPTPNAGYCSCTSCCTLGLDNSTKRPTPPAPPARGT